MTGERHKLAVAISDARGCGRVVCADFEEGLSLSQLALLAGLDSSVDNYRECSLKEARYIAGRVISHGLVDDGRLVPQTSAEELAASFLDFFSQDTSRYWTNGEFLFAGNSSYLNCWKQVTPELFSCGILVVSSSRTGVLWIAEEHSGNIAD